jgi:hypothetical protein
MTEIRASAFSIDISNIAKSVLIVLDLTPVSKLRMRSILSRCLMMNRSSDAMSCRSSSAVFISFPYTNGIVTHQSTTTVNRTKQKLAHMSAAVRLCAIFISSLIVKTVAPLLLMLAATRCRYRVAVK